MAANYYYLVAQLPALFPTQAPPMSSEDLMQLCASLMDDADVVPLRSCVLDPFVEEAAGPSGSHVVDSWLRWERSLRSSLAKARAQKLKRDQGGRDSVETEDAEAASAAKTALMADSPLEAELLLDKARWAAIDSLQGTNYFSRDSVYAYALKLKLLERRAKFRAEEGFAAYKTIYADVLAGAPTHIAAGVLS